jgi:hypothetical protein
MLSYQVGYPDMIFVESRAFTARVAWHIDDDEYSKLQTLLAVNPQVGLVIRGCNGLRKVRWGTRSRGKGKRSGARIVYLHTPEADRIDLLLIYGKDESDDLTAEQKRALAGLAERARQEARGWAIRQRSGT